MKKYRAAVLFLTLTLILTLLTASVQGAPVTINVYNWGQYIADGTGGSLDVIAAFEEAYPGIRVNYMTYDSNESMYTKLKTGGASFDVIIPSDYMVEKLREEDMLLPLNLENIPNFQYIDESFRNPAYDPENLYSVPYTWGCVGVIYNADYVNEEDAGSWDLLWNSTYAGKVLMFDNPRDAFAIAQLLLGQSLNTEDPEELRLAAEKLQQERPILQGYVMDQIFGKMERGEAWAAPYYAGDYLLMAEENPSLKFYFPEEGFNLFVDAACIPKSCAHKAEAETFINFLLEPEICGQNLEYLGYSAPMTAARAYMDPEVSASSIAYPPAEVLDRGRGFSALSPEGNHTMNDLWLTVKTADNSTTAYLILTGAALVTVVVLWIVLKLRKRRRKARRCMKWRSL